MHRKQTRPCGSLNAECRWVEEGRQAYLQRVPAGKRVPSILGLSKQAGLGPEACKLCSSSSRLGNEPLSDQPSPDC